MSLISDDGELRRKLQNYGLDVGPITDTTRSLYQKKLRTLTKNNHTNNVRSPAGIKRQRHQAETKRAKKAKLDAGRVSSRKHHPNHPHIQAKKQVHLYPDLSDWLTPPVTYPQEPPSSTHPSPGSPVVSIPGSPSSPALQPNLNYFDPPVARSDPPSSPGDDSSDQLSPVLSSDSEESPSSSSLSLPSPRPPFSDGSSLSSFTPSPSKPKEKGGFLQTVTKFFGSRVNQLFNKAEPRRSLKSSFGLANKDNSHGCRKQSAVTFKPVNLASIADDMDGEIAEASSLSSNHSEQSGSSSFLEDKKYDWELDPTEVSLCKKADGSLWRLGKGGFGEVFKGLRDGADEVAVKIIRLTSCSPKTIMQFKAEIDLISKLRHRHIVQFYGACIQPQNLYMVTELMSNDLFSVLKLPLESERYKWTGIYGKEVLIGTASGLNYLHSRKPPVVHRDIKSPNILVMDGLAKIADVGVARTMGASDMTAQRGFTIAWAAPEVVYRRRATEKIDIWSLGIIIWEVVTGKSPRPGKLVLPEASLHSLRSLYFRCVSEAPGNRPSSLDVVTELKHIQE